MCEQSLSDGNGEADHVGVKNEALKKERLETVFDRASI